MLFMSEVVSSEVGRHELIGHLESMLGFDDPVDCFRYESLHFNLTAAAYKADFSHRFKMYELSNGGFYWVPELNKERVELHTQYGQQYDFTELEAGLAISLAVQREYMLNHPVNRFSIVRYDQLKDFASTHENWDVLLAFSSTFH